MLTKKYKEVEMLDLNLSNENNQLTHKCPSYSDKLYATIANQYIGKEVILPASRKKHSSKYFIEYIHKIPRNIQQRLVVGNAKSWNNMVYLYNSFANELGYKKITNKIQGKKSSSLRMCDIKDGDGCCSYNSEDMVYMSDGMYIHKNDAWW
jgi:hypothetical protein